MKFLITQNQRIKLLPSSLQRKSKCLQKSILAQVKTLNLQSVMDPRALWGNKPIVTTSKVCPSGIRPCKMTQLTHPLQLLIRPKIVIWSARNYSRPQKTYWIASHNSWKPIIRSMETNPVLSHPSQVASKAQAPQSSCLSSTRALTTSRKCNSRHTCCRWCKLSMRRIPAIISPCLKMSSSHRGVCRIRLLKMRRNSFKGSEMKNSAVKNFRKC